MKNLLVLCGGQSPEHQISIRSTKNILDALDRSCYSVTLVGISQSGEWRNLSESELNSEIVDQGERVILHPGKTDCLWCEGKSLGVFDVVFPILHGPNGEDGSMQGLLRLLGLPFVGPNVLSSAMAMDKDVTKQILHNAGLNVAKWMVVKRGETLPEYEDVCDQLGEVVFVKPANMGSSVGVHRVAASSEWANALNDALKYDQKIVIEEAINGRELECAVLGNEEVQSTGVGEVESGAFYSFDEKYADASAAKIIIPAPVGPHLSALKQTAIDAYKALGCEGMSRVDMFLKDDGTILVNEINTIPGFTTISMYPKLWEQEGLDYTALVDRLITLAIQRGG